MDPELLYKKMIARKPHVRENTWNALTILSLLATMAILVVLLVIFNDPAAGINPYPPPAKPAKVGQAAVLALPTDLPPSPSPTLEPTVNIATEIPVVTDVSVVKPTTAVIVLEATPAILDDAQPTSEPVKPGKYAFSLQANPQGISASLYQPTRACAWMGVAGRVFDIQNRPVKGIRVAITGWLGDHTVNLLSLTGTALQYGPSGYEFTLAEAPDATSGQLKIQLMDQSDLPLSDVVVLDTYVECERNLILVDFKQTGLAAGQ